MGLKHIAFDIMISNIRHRCGLHLNALTNLGA